jgi:homoprotocatechuate degradation regulator HpaR
LSDIKSNDESLAKELRAFEDALPIALLRAREAVMIRFRPMLARNGVTEQQWRVLRAIQENKNVDATKLSEWCCLLMPSLSRILRTMESDGLITRTRATDDARRQSVELTADGKALFEKIAPQSEAIYAEIEQALTKDRVSEMVDGLRTMMSLLK